MRSRKNQGIAAFFDRLVAATSRRPSEHETDYQGLGPSAGGLDAEYRRLVSHHLRRWGVPETCTSIDIQQVGSHKGKEVFVANICLVSWDRDAVLRVLVGLPLLDKKIRKAAQALWLADVSTFNGVLLTVSEALHEPVPSAELRELLVTLTSPKEGHDAPEAEAVPVAH